MNERKVVNMSTKEVFPSIKAAAEAYGCSKQAINNVLHYRQRRAANCRWCYLQESEDDESKE